MAYFLHGHPVTAVFEQRSISWRKFLRHVLEIMQGFARRRRERRELLAYMAIDHRVAKDMGITESEALEWAARPFWRG